MARTWWLSGCVVAALSATAVADTVFATSATFTQPSAAPNNGTYTLVSPTMTNADDGTQIRLQLFNTFADPWDFNLIATFGAGNPSDSPAIVLYMGSVVAGGGLTWQIVGAVWYPNASPTDTATLNTVSSSSPFTVNGTSNQTLVLPGSGGTSNYTLGGSFAFGTTVYDRLNLTIRLTNNSGTTLIAGGSSIGFDAISNPEPGTFALFGLGALGLGGMAWRRRAARRRNELSAATKA